MKVLLYIGCTLALLCLGVTADQDKPCDDGWSYHRGFCFQVQEDYETFRTSELSCGLRGGYSAYAFSDDSLTFLKSLVKKQNKYAFWYGAKVDRRYKNIISGSGRKYRIGETNSIPYPEDTVFYAPMKESDCVALSSNMSYYITNPSMQVLDCNLKLPYICRGELSSGPKVINTGSQYERNNSYDLYWFSSPLDRLTYQAASDACKAKSMTLLSIRDVAQKKFITQQINLRSLGSVDPWWIGLHVANDGSTTWQNGVTMIDGVVNWFPSNSLRASYWQKRLLRFDGTVLPTSWSIVYAPYICMKHSNQDGKYGCPHSWNRAGQSCYKIDKKKDNYVTQFEADKVCKKMNSHVVSIDSMQEKIWLTGVVKSNIWTSLNDYAKTGSFLWEDGSKPNDKILQWKRRLSGSGRCFVFSNYYKSIHQRKCQFTNPAGCQYKAPQNGKCVSRHWRYYKGNCYLLPAKRNNYLRRPYETMLHICYAITEPYNASLPITPLKIDNKGVMDFISKNLYSKYSRIWVGMQMDDSGKIKYFDKTIPDLSFFPGNIQPNLGSPSDPNHCAYMSEAGEFYTSKCHKVLIAKMVCEKEIPFKARISNKARSVQSHFLLTISAVFIVLKGLIH